MDLPSMDPCPHGKKGRHQLAAIIPGDDEHDITLYCEQCGALRRAPATGPVLAERLDDLSAEEIKRATR